MSYALYLALGDSMSIDDYAGPGLGAASLLYRNDSKRWPDFQGRDLWTRCPGCKLAFRARNGLDSHGLQKTMLDLPACDGKVLVTLTMGGNDLIGALRQKAGENAEVVRDRLLQALDLLACYSNPTVLMGNIYDPTDGSGVLGSGYEWFAPAVDRLPVYNAMLAAVAKSRGATLIDIHGAFLGHMNEYYSFDIEPGVQGADALRRLWWTALFGADSAP